MALTEIGARLRLTGAPAFKRDTDRAAGGLGRIGREAADADRKMGRLSSAMKSIGKGAVLGGVGAAVAGVGALSVGLMQGFRDAYAMETRMAKTNAVIASTKGVANVSADSIKKMSDRLESLSMIDQDAIINGQNLLLTFTKVRNEVGAGNDIFNQASEAMVNLSAAMGQDPKTAAIMLGKALNDPVKGLTAMGKAGIQFTKQQKEQIKALVASGKTMDAQKIILGELETQFGGAAKAAGSGFEGAIFRAKDALGDMFRDVATPLLPAFTENIERLGRYLTDTATPAIIGFVDGFKDKTGAGGQFRDDLNGIWAGVKDVWPHLKNVTDKTVGFVRFLSEHGTAVKVFAVGFASYVASMKVLAAMDLIKIATGLFAVNSAAAGGAGAAGAGGVAGAAAKGGKLAKFGKSAGVAGVIGMVGGMIDSEFIERNGRYKDTVLPDGRINRFDAKNGTWTILPAPPRSVKPRPGGSSQDRSTVLTPVTPTYPRKAANGNLTAAPAATVTRTTVVVPVQLNGREIGRAVIEDLEDRGARQ